MHHFQLLTLLLCTFNLLELGFCFGMLSWNLTFLPIVIFFISILSRLWRDSFKRRWKPLACSSLQEWRVGLWGHYHMPQVCHDPGFMHKRLNTVRCWGAGRSHQFWKFWVKVSGQNHPQASTVWRWHWKLWFLPTWGKLQTTIQHISITDQCS